MNVKELIQLDTAGRNVNWNSSLKNNFELSGEAEDTHNIMILFLESGNMFNNSHDSITDSRKTGNQ